VTAVVDAVDAQAGGISQMIGDVLLQVVEHVPGGGTLQTGHGYLVSDYPVTQDVLSARRPRLVSLDDDHPDEAEAVLLRQLGYDALLMLPLVTDGAVWGLVELYAAGRGFDDGDVRAAERALTRVLAGAEGAPRAAPPPDSD
jgi:transcriptional regulator with GAF, ATPase, and Fis domain